MKIIKLFMIPIIFLLIACHPTMVQLLPSEKTALTAYNQAFFNNSRESQYDYAYEVHYLLYSFGSQERLKKEWNRLGYDKKFYEWKNYQAVMLPSELTKGLPEVWGVLHRSVSIGLLDYDKPHIYTLWHEEYHIRADGDLRLLYPDSDPFTLEKPMKDPRDPRDTEDKILKMADELNKKGFIAVPKDQWENMNKEIENLRRQVK